MKATNFWFITKSIDWASFLGGQILCEHEHYERIRVITLRSFVSTRLFLSDLKSYLSLSYHIEDLITVFKLTLYELCICILCHNFEQSGPEVIKLSRVRTRTPNRTPCSKLYSYSRSRGYKTFQYSYSYSSGV